MLELNKINVFYGGIHALKDLSIKVNEGEIVTLVGSNGAGKTSMLKTISGIVKPKSGIINYLGKDITNCSASEIVKMEIAHVPEGRRVFGNMSVMENLEMGAFIRKDKSEIKEDYEKIFERFKRLKERRNQMAGTLSGGEQQMLAMGRALMLRPKLILLDEPSMGLAPIMVDEIFSIIKEINEGGTTVLLVEQNANMALSIAHRAYVIQTGSIALEGKACDLLKDESVKNTYLGG
ncbi:branched-chain amino acid transport system ATP-binding protein [Clostridium tetanomorphum]|uniref:ABC transporter ATP-binding protein n=1 Tax=Clostridium tetanomorphum TaxID=1553 RepID=A0A923EE31_CLOTT|nr:ABC transporter ATP-binding protein [Clostridium tetanomorphum]KAJ50742.1 branched-chain amino acid abc transporter ATP-binding protein [Clostridium tetanomorphum DSM 665]MBC2399961.1 ABC transporter ATP-binding protein [Clostridium tetanomorphum]MBP1865839.1 branched-chain amino acid transport system ATP-binding protein [Clostridium tetanomorphum]NRS85288.1 branched-chain amino acid transport system ATP-binding protein [Clostridium tetanomorphum]NRZ98465.1 branched-chain amino acid transpo